MIKRPRFLDHITRGVIQVGVELGLFHDGHGLRLQELNLFGDDGELAAGYAARPFVGVLYLHRQSYQVVGIRVFVRTSRGDQLNATGVGVGFDQREGSGGLVGGGRGSRYRGINVGWKKNQHHIGDFLVLVEYISITLSHEKKIFKNQFFNNFTLKCLNVNGS